MRDNDASVNKDLRTVNDLEILKTVYEMMKKNSTYLSDNKRSLSGSKNERLGHSLRPSNRYYEKEEKETIIIKKDLPADHLTATYWG